MNVFYFFISLFLFLSAPNEYNFLFCLIVSILFLIQAIPFLIKISKGNYINFYTIFFFSFFFVNFFYPILLYPIDPYYFHIFSYDFNELFINKGTALSQLSISSFILGATQVKKVKSRNKFISNYPFNPITILTIVLFLLFLATVGGRFLAGDFDAHSSLSLYILLLLSSSLPLAVILFFKNKGEGKGKRLLYALIVSYILLFLMIGDRGPGLSLIILIVALYNFYIRPLKLTTIVSLAFVGITLMFLIGLGRTTNIENIQGNVISRGIEKARESDNDNVFYEMTKGFVVNTRNLYVGLDYVDKKGVNYGTTMFGSFIAVIPFAQTFVHDILEVHTETSSDFFTILYFGDNPPYGLGTNLVADVYIVFGVLGSIFLFFIFGRIVEYFRLSSMKNGDILSIIVYFYLLSRALGYPRNGLFYILKFIIWTYFIFYLMRKLGVLKPVLIRGK